MSVCICNLSIGARVEYIGLVAETVSSGFSEQERKEDTMLTFVLYLCSWVYTNTTHTEKLSEAGVIVHIYSVGT